MRFSLAAFVERFRSPRPPPQRLAERRGGVREVTDHGYRIRLDLTEQVLGISVRERDAFLHQEASDEEPLQPTPDRWSGFHPLDPAKRRPQFVAAAMLVQKAKQFDDGLYAAVETAAQKGVGKLAGKGRFLEALAGRLARRGDAGAAQALILASGRLGGLRLRVPPQLVTAVDALTAAFLQDEGASKPLGFYTWSKDLKAIFQQDRLLQRELEDSCIRPLVDALCQEPSQQGAYEAFLRLASRLTNPLASADLRSFLGTNSPASGAVSFFPASASHEGDLVKRLYGNRTIPESFSLIEELIQRIRSGDLVLTPTDSSGWYDYQTWAHQPFVIPDRMPEAARLRFEGEYRELLLDLFRGAQALARETNVKQLEMLSLGATPFGPRVLPTILTVSPNLTVEPIASYYLRRARSYRFVREVLEGAFGPAGLEEIKCLRAEGPRRKSIATELRAIEAIFRGAYLTSCDEIGLPLEPSALPTTQNDRDREGFVDWAKALHADPDLGQDARMMVPIFYDIERRRTKVWAFMGWSAKTIEVSYSANPAAQVFDGRGREVPVGEDLELFFLPESHQVPRSVTAEVYVTRLLDREEFRRHCDKYKTRAAILAALG